MTKAVRGTFAVIASAIVILATWAASALAQEQYPGGVAGTGTGGGGDVSGGDVAGASGSLPFTGADLLLYVIVGLAIVASGVVLRQVAARRSR
jgi:hypothetical protein